MLKVVVVVADVDALPQRNQWAGRNVRCGDNVDNFDLMGGAAGCIAKSSISSSHFQPPGNCPLRSVCLCLLPSPLPSPLRGVVRCCLVSFFGGASASVSASLRRACVKYLRTETHKNVVKQSELRPGTWQVASGKCARAYKLNFPLFIYLKKI